MLNLHIPNPGPQSEQYHPYYPIISRRPSINALTHQSLLTFILFWFSLLLDWANRCQKTVEKERESHIYNRYRDCLPTDREEEASKSFYSETWKHPIPFWPRYVETSCNTELSVGLLNYNCGIICYLETVSQQTEKKMSVNISLVRRENIQSHSDLHMWTRLAILNYNTKPIESRRHPNS